MSGFGFPCHQTPLRFADTFNLQTISEVTMGSTNPYGNAAARLWSILPGTGIISNPNNGSGGILVDENIQTSFTLNGVTYYLIDMRIFAGQHSIFRWLDISGQSGSAVTKTGVYAPSPLEVYIFFKNNINQIICLVLPIGIDDAPSSSTNASRYINALTTSAGATPPVLSTLFQDLSGATSSTFHANNLLLHYIGQDIRTYESTACDPTSLNNPVTYLVIMNDIERTNLISSTITSNEYDALLKKVSPSPTMSLNGAIQMVDSTPNIISNMKFLPAGLFYVTNSSAGGGRGQSTVTTSAVKCYPMNPSKNIKGNELYLDENGAPTTLADEVNPPAPPPPTSSFWLSAAGIETIIAIIVALILSGIIIYFLVRYHETRTAIVAGVKTAAEATKVGAIKAGTVIGTGIKQGASKISGATIPNTGIPIVGVVVIILLFLWAIIMTILYATKK